MGIKTDKRKEFLEERSYHELALTVSEEQMVDLVNLALVYFTTYAIAVSEKGRALPDVEDGFKSSQRRILFALYKLGITPDKDVVTSVNIVGKTLAD
jgi:DNA gyrase/topoisomerase IV subunit A